MIVPFWGRLLYRGTAAKARHAASKVWRSHSMTPRGTHYKEACGVLFIDDFVMRVRKLENRQTRSEAPKAFRNPVWCKWWDLNPQLNACFLTAFDFSSIPARGVCLFRHTCIYAVYYCTDGEQCRSTLSIGYSLNLPIPTKVSVLDTQTLCVSTRLFPAQ